MIIRVPMAAAAGLALLALTEILIPSGAAPAPDRVASLPHLDAGLGPAGLFSADWSAAILARPLFRPNRRPVPAPSLAVVVDTTLPRLSAIFFTAAGRMAVFDGTPPQVVSIGGAVGAYVVRKITPDSVLLRGPNGDVTVHPQFTTAAGQAGADAAANDSSTDDDAPPVPANIQPPPAPFSPRLLNGSQ